MVASHDPKGQTRTSTYDELGRLKTLVDPDGTSNWVYDQGVNALGRLSESFSPSIAGAPRQRVRYAYEPPTASNNRGALDTLTYVVDGTEYESSFEYDGLGRTHRIHYPELAGSTAKPVVAQYLYDESGALEGLDEVGGSAAKPIWRLMEAFEGQLVQRETFGNGAATTVMDTTPNDASSKASIPRSAASIFSASTTSDDNGLLAGEHRQQGHRGRDGHSRVRLRPPQQAVLRYPHCLGQPASDDLLWLRRHLEHHELWWHRHHLPHHAAPFGSRVLGGNGYQYDDNGKRPRANRSGHPWKHPNYPVHPLRSP